MPVRPSCGHGVPSAAEKSFIFLAPLSLKDSISYLGVSNIPARTVLHGSNPLLTFALNKHDPI